MRFMIIVKADADTEAGDMPDEQLLAALALYHEELARGGVLLDGSGLHRGTRGWRVRYAGGNPTVVDGSFAERKEIIAGYTLIQTRSREEALEWTRRFPAPFGPGMEAEIEVREVVDPEDFPSAPAIERARNMNGGKAARR